MSRIIHALRLMAATALVLLAASPPAAAASAPAAGPQQLIQHFQDTLLKAMKQGQQLGYTGRSRLLRPVLDQTFDWEGIARIALGQYWTQLDTAQRSRFIDTFGKLSTATYASRFDSYSGERFSAPQQVKADSDRAIVRSDLIESDGSTVSFNYQLHRAGGQWRVVNVIADGVSDLAMKRAEYAGILRSSGFDGLMDRLEQKIVQYGTGNPE
jgi:phospholipid transport system substrate-binding protein